MSGLKDKKIFWWIIVKQLFCCLLHKKNAKHWVDFYTFHHFLGAPSQRKLLALTSDILSHNVYCYLAPFPLWNSDSCCILGINKFGSFAETPSLKYFETEPKQKWDYWFSCELPTMPMTWANQKLFLLATLTAQLGSDTAPPLGAPVTLAAR